MLPLRGQSNITFGDTGQMALTALSILRVVLSCTHERWTAPLGLRFPASLLVLHQ